MRVLLVIYDNESYIHIMPMGMAQIAAILRENAGCEVEIYSQDVHHWSEEHLTRHLDDNKYDMVAVSVIAGYYQYAKLLKISEAINRSKNRPFYVLGGYGPTPEPEFFMQKTSADLIAMGEGDISAVEIIKALRGEKKFEDVLGIAYRDGDQIKINPRQPLVQDLDSLPLPAYDLFEMEHYRLFRPPNSSSTTFSLPVMSARGCTFKCTFCYRMDTGYRARDPKALLDEVEMLYRDYGINYISFQDDLLMSSVKHTEEVCNEFMRRRREKGLDIKWNCNGRLNYCSKELLQLMKDAGCVFINYGIESVDNDVLKYMKKGLRFEQIEKGIEDTLEIGISPGLNMLFGNIGDNLETLRRSVDFLVKYDDGAQLRTIRPVTPYPGSPLYYRAIQDGLLEGPEDFYVNKHLNSDLISVNFTDLTEEEYYNGLKEANLRLVENYHSKQHKRTADNIVNLYDTLDTSFRGLRHSH